MNELFVYESAYSDKATLIEIQQSNTLILSKLKGIPYLDVPEWSEELINVLAKAISRFHSIQHIGDKVLCHWDNQPRNILWSQSEKKIWLVDFEDVRLAHPEADIAHLFLFWAEALHPDIFKKNVQVFISNYQPIIPLEPQRWKAELRKAKVRFDHRRRNYNKKERVANPLRNSNRKFLVSLILK